MQEYWKNVQNNFISQATAMQQMGRSQNILPGYIPYCLYYMIWS